MELFGPKRAQASRVCEQTRLRRRTSAADLQPRKPRNPRKPLPAAMSATPTSPAAPADPTGITAAAFNAAGPQSKGNPFEFRRQLADRTLQPMYDAILANVENVVGPVSSAVPADELEILFARFEGTLPPDHFAALKALILPLLERSLLEFYWSEQIAADRTFSLFDRIASTKLDNETSRPSILCGSSAPFNIADWIAFVFNPDPDDGVPFYPTKLEANTHKQYKAFKTEWEPFAKELQVCISCVFDAVITKIVHESAKISGCSAAGLDAVVADLNSTVDHAQRVAALIEVARMLAKRSTVLTITETPYDVAIALAEAVDTHTVHMAVEPRPHMSQITVMLVSNELSKQVNVSEAVHAAITDEAVRLGLAEPSPRSICAVDLNGKWTAVGFHSTSDGQTTKAVIAAMTGNMVVMGDANCVAVDPKGKKLTHAKLLELADAKKMSTSYRANKPTMNRFRTVIGAQPLKASTRNERECKDGVLVCGAGKVVGTATVNRPDGTCDDGERPTTEWPSDHYATVARIELIA